MNNKIHFILAFATVIILFYILTLARLDNPQFNLILVYTPLIIQGVINTLIISLASLICSILLGIIIYAMNNSTIFYFRYIAQIFSQIMLGTPLLVFIIIVIYYFGFSLFNYGNKFILGIVAISLYTAPYMTNIFKSQIESIDKEQFVVMELYDFNTYCKYVYIIIPQIIKRLIPPLINNLSMVIKGSALLSTVAVTDVYYAIEQAQSKSFAYEEGYLLMWLLYLCITIPLSLSTIYFEKRLNK